MARGLDDKPEIVALNKADLVEPKLLAKLQKKLAKASGAEVLAAVGRDARTGSTPCSTG